MSGSTHMVVAVLADIVEIIVFATCTDALLCVYRTLQLGQRLSLANCPKKDGLELVHARIRKEQGGVIVRDDRGRGYCGAVRSAKFEGVYAFWQGAFSWELVKFQKRAFCVLHEMSCTQEDACCGGVLVLLL
jgi:hypothetical protein